MANRGENLEAMASKRVDGVAWIVVNCRPSIEHQLFRGRSLSNSESWHRHPTLQPYETSTSCKTATLPPFSQYEHTHSHSHLNMAAATNEPFYLRY